MGFVVVDSDRLSEAVMALMGVGYVWLADELKEEAMDANDYCRDCYCPDCQPDRDESRD